MLAAITLDVTFAHFLYFTLIRIHEDPCPLINNFNPFSLLLE